MPSDSQILPLTLEDFIGSTATLESVATANATILSLRSRILPSMLLDASQPLELAASLIRAYNQAVLRRFLELFSAAVVECRQGRELASIICVRALIETGAMYMDFSSTIESVLQNPDHSAVAITIKNQILKTRVPQFENEDTRAKNILTQIAKLAKEHPSLEEGYAVLSDHAHPNLGGTFAFYTAFDGDTAVFREKGQHAAHVLVHASADLLRILKSRVRFGRHGSGCLPDLDCTSTTITGGPSHVAPSPREHSLRR